MEINPQTVQLQKPLTQHIIKIELQWTPENILGGIINYDESGNNPCIVTGGSGGQYGSATYQIIDKVGGHYNIQFSFNIPCEYPRIVLSAQYSIYYDQEFIRSGEFTLGDCYSGSSYPHHNTTYRSPLITDYSFPIYNPNLCYGSGIPIQLEYGHGCTDIEIDTSRAAGDVINLQILTGSEFVSFYDQQGNATDNITVLNSELERVELKQDVLYSGIPTDVLVQSTISGLSKDNTFKIYPKSEYKIDVSYVSYPIKSNEIKYMEVISLGPGGCYVKLPEEIKLEAKIIKGNALGHLEDFDNGVSGDSLNNIVFNDFGGNHIGFVGEGVNGNNIDTVIVRFSTTDIELNIIDVPIIITPGSLVVEIEPDTLLPGQSAIIRIKERLDDGRIVDFSDQQTFEIGILDGCILGKLNAEGIDTNYFYGVTKPIFFTADTNAISGTVKLRVGAIYEVTPGRPEKVETEFRSKGSEKQNSTTSQFCYIGEYLTSDYTYANVVVGNDECEKDRPNGLSFIDESMFEITQLSNNWECK